MHFIPILSSLGRHRTATALIVLEIAFTCAIVCNAIFLIGDRMTRMDRPSGVVEDELVHVQIAGIGPETDAAAVTNQDLVALRAIPGVKSVAITDQLPFGRSSSNSDITTKPNDPMRPINATIYLGSEDLLETFGVRLIAGRDFTPDEYADMDAVLKQQARVPSVIITRGVAERLFPGVNPLGQKLYLLRDDPQIVVGVIDILARPNEFNWAGQSYAVVLPARVPYNFGGDYVLRVDPARKSEVLAAVDGVLHKIDRSRIILKHETFAEIRSQYFRQDRAMAWMLLGVSLALLIITSLGVVGLASFWVQQRTRQIGIRRALGATRRDILRYFQTENFILATLGIVIGMGLAYAINLWMMAKYEAPRLPAEFLPIGALLLWILGQIAVLGPAMRASAIPPATATRSV